MLRPQALRPLYDARQCSHDGVADEKGALCLGAELLAAVPAIIGIAYAAWTLFTNILGLVIGGA